MLSSETLCARLSGLAVFYSGFNSETARQYAAFARLACSRISDNERQLAAYRRFNSALLLFALALSLLLVYVVCASVVRP